MADFNFVSRLQLLIKRAFSFMLSSLLKIIHNLL